MKSTKEDLIAKLCEQVEAGKLETSELRAAWDQIYAQAGNEIRGVADIVGHPIVFCDCCGKPCFAAKTKSVYSGAYWVCIEECFGKYGYCIECKTYILLEDMNNPTHHHDIKVNPGRLHFPAEPPIAVYNADIMESSRAAFYKTQDELRVLASRRARSTNPERVFRNFGVELEVEKAYGGPPDLLSRTRKVFGDFVMVKRDGSLSRRGQGGFEIVTAPATLAFHKGGIWNSFFQNLGTFFQEQPPTTGLHIHVGLNTVNPLTVAKILLFINAEENREFVFALANRNLLKKNPNGRIYAGVRAWREGDMIRLKQHQGGCPWHPNNVGQKSYYQMVGGAVQFDPYGNPIIANLDGTPAMIRPTCKCAEGHYNIEHYEAVNLRTHRPTVEFRIFRGIVNESFLYACLEFVDSLCDFCATVSHDRVHYENYLEFLADKTKRYRNLYRLLVNQCWIDPPKDKTRTEQIPAFGVYA